MKTIQQIIREMNSKKMKNAFFCEHPIELFDISGLDDKPLGEITETKKRTIVEMDIPIKLCIPVMEIWM